MCFTVVVCFALSESYSIPGHLGECRDCQGTALLGTMLICDITCVHCVVVITCCLIIMCFSITVAGVHVYIIFSLVYYSFGF